MHNLLYLHYILNAVMYTFVVYNNKKLYKRRKKISLKTSFSQILLIARD